MKAFISTFKTIPLFGRRVSETDPGAGSSCGSSDRFPDNRWPRRCESVAHDRGWTRWPARLLAPATICFLLYWLLGLPPFGKTVGGSSFDTDPPDVEYLGSVSEGLFQPIRIACDGQGRLYVTETLRGEVRVFSPSGDLRSVRKPVPDPLSIAVDSRNYIYVGAESGGVTIYDYAWNEVGSFGYSDGPGRLRMPSDIAIDANDERLYITDSEASDVKVFSLDGAFLFSFGTDLDYPSGVAVDVKGNRVVVGDHNSSNVRVFSADGDTVFSFGGKGSQAGNMVRVQGICTDGYSRMYVTDAFLGIVQVYDDQGSYLGYIGALGDEPGKFRQPMDICVDQLNRLVVVSANTSSMELFRVGDLGRYDGPTTPVLIWPEQNAWIDETSPTLILSRAYDSNDPSLEYDIEVYRDEWMSSLEVSTESGGDLVVLSATVVWQIPTELKEGGTYWWRARAKDKVGPGAWTPTGRFSVSWGEPLKFYLSQSYPNPFSSQALIRFGLARDCRVDLRIFDVTGRQVRVLKSEPMGVGDHEVFWDGRGDDGRRAVSGIYWYRIVAGDFTEVRKLVLVQ